MTMHQKIRDLVSVAAEIQHSPDSNSAPLLYTEEIMMQCLQHFYVYCSEAGISTILPRSERCIRTDCLRGEG